MSQIETIMLVALGFVAALLVGLLLFRILWSYALSLGKRRVEKRAPSAIAELQADRDRLKAEYAMQGRRLQLRLDDLKTRMTEQMAEASRNRNRIEQLANEIRSRDEQLAKKDLEIANFKSQCDALERELADRTELVQQTKDLLLTREEEASELQGRLVEVENRISDQALVSQTMDVEVSRMAASANGQGGAKTEFDTAHERLRLRIEELNSLTRQIDEQRRDLSVQQEELTTLRNQITRSNSSDKKATAALNALAGNTATEDDNDRSEAVQAMSGIDDASQQLERQIRLAEAETESLTEELSRLDEMWKANADEFGLSDDKARKTTTLSLVSSNDQRRKPSEKPATKTKAVRKKPAAKSKTGTSGKPKKTTPRKDKVRTTRPVSKTAKTKVRKASKPASKTAVKPDVVLPDTTSIVDLANEQTSNFTEPDSSTLEALELHEKTNVISLAQRIRLLQTDLTRKS